jgi:outer membrane biogenesis lipoprotein LolB
VKKNIIIILLLLFIVVIASGCAPTKSIPTDRVLSADRLIKKMEANRRKVKTFVGSGVIRISSSHVNASSTFQVSLKKPDSLAISFYGPFGIDLAHALITPQNFQFYEVINNILYRGRTRDGIIQSILKVDFSLDEIIDALAGSVNLTEKLRVDPDKISTSGNNFILSYLDPSNGIERVFSINNDNLAISENILKKIDGKVLLEGKYSRFRSYEDVPIPHEIVLNDLVNKQNLKVEYRKIDVNKNSIGLKLDIPADVKIIEW